jgi:hypothetical protein
MVILSVVRRQLPRYRNVRRVAARAVRFTTDAVNLRAIAATFCT